MPRGSEFLTVQEVADLLKLNQQTIRNMIDRGERGMCVSARGASGCASRSSTLSWRLASRVRSLSRPILGDRSARPRATSRRPCGRGTPKRSSG